MGSNRILVFKNAFEGIYSALKTEANLKFHFVAGLTALILAIYLKITLADFTKIIILIGLVISLELTNTAIEVVVNSFTEQAHPHAKRAKDIAAGAVLIASLTALIVGLLIFLPYL